MSYVVKQSMFSLGVWFVTHRLTWSVHGTYKSKASALRAAAKLNNAETLATL
jgi:hypothetical protein